MTAPLAHPPVRRVSIDPALGRIAFPAGCSGQCAGDLSRCFSMAWAAGNTSDGKCSYSAGRRRGRVGPESAGGSRWARGGGIVEIGDYGRYAAEETLSIVVEADARLELAPPTSTIRADSPAGVRVELRPGSELTLNGLLIAGGVCRGRASRPAAGRGLDASSLYACAGVGPHASGMARFPDQPSLVVNLPA